MQWDKSGHQAQNTCPDTFPKCTKKEKHDAEDQDGRRRSVTVKDSGTKCYDITDCRDQERPAVNDDGDDCEHREDGEEEEI